MIILDIHPAGRGTFHADLDGTPIATTEIPPDERPAIIELYRKKAGRGVASHFDALPAPEDHPVFRIGAA